MLSWKINHVKTSGQSSQQDSSSKKFWAATPQTTSWLKMMPCVSSRELHTKWWQSVAQAGKELSVTSVRRFIYCIVKFKNVFVHVKYWRSTVLKLTARHGVSSIYMWHVLAFSGAQSRNLDINLIIEEMIYSLRGFLLVSYRSPLSNCSKYGSVIYY